MHSLTTTSGQARLGSIDSIRGLAALFVLFGHTMSSFEWNTDFIQYPILNNFFDGRSAVTMFFVLSGFVLTFGYFNHPERSLAMVPFYARRFTRIWIPWFAIFLISIVAKELVSRPGPPIHPPSSAWLQSMWQGATTLHDVSAQMVFQLHAPDRMLLVQDWSLGVELRASIFIPLLLILARWKWVSLVVIAFTFSYLKASGFLYAPFFAGVLVAYWNSKTVQFRRPWILLLLGFLFYQLRWFAGSTQWLPNFIQEREIWLISTLACALILAGSLRSSRCRLFLEHRFFLYLGRVSYSLYLLQMVVLICLTPYLMAAFNQLGLASNIVIQPFILLFVSIICLGLADLSERYVEVPCVQLGKYITRRLNQYALVRKLHC